MLLAVGVRVHGAEASDNGSDDGACALAGCSAREEISLEMPCDGAIANSHGGLRPDELHERKIKGTRNESESYLDLIATITRCLFPI